LSSKKENKMVTEWPEVMSLAVAANYLGISTSNLYDKARVGIIPSFRIGPLYKFKKERLEKWMAEQSKGGNDE
jgi:PTS system nitrogen regulatory IIA component